MADNRIKLDRATCTFRLEHKHVATLKRLAKKHKMPQNTVMNELIANADILLGARA